MNDSSAEPCPEPLRTALLELVRWSLIVIRNDSAAADQVCAYADHVHNLPALVAQFHVDGLAYYWDVERPCFLKALERLDAQPPYFFKLRWATIEDEYHRRCGSSPA